MKLKHIIIASILFLIAATFSYTAMSVGASPSDVITPGVYIQGRELSGLGQAQAQKELASLNSEIGALKLKLVYGGLTKTITPAEAGISLDIQAMLGPALEAGHQGNLMRKMLQQRRIRESGLEVPLVFVVDQKKLDKLFDGIAEEINAKPVNAELKINSDDTVSVVPGKEGMAVERQSALKEMQRAISSGQQGLEVELALVLTSPSRTTGEMQEMGVNGLLAAYTTSFNARLLERSYNVKVAAEAIDGLMVAPGEIVSFNKVVGPRSSEAGYKNAKIIVNDKFVDGLGGGVCQVSSTLYNVVLLSGLEILERSNHSVPISYVPAGRDATVVFGVLDLVFKNNTGKYLYFKALVGPGKLTFKIYGNTQYKKQISIKTNILEVYDFKTINQPDPSLEKDLQEVKTEGIKGMKVVAQRITLENGTPRSEPLPSSLYKPLNKVVLVGTGEVVKVPDDKKPVGSSTDPDKPGGETQVTSPDAGKEPPVTGGPKKPGTPAGGGAGGIIPPTTN